MHTHQNTPHQSSSLPHHQQDSTNEDNKLKVLASPGVSISLSAFTSAASSTTTSDALSSVRVKEQPSTRADSSSSPSSGLTTTSEDRLHITENGGSC